MARTEYGHLARLLLHHSECGIAGSLYARSCGTGKMFLQTTRFTRLTVSALTQGPSWLYYSFAIGIWMSAFPGSWRVHDGS